MPTVEVVPDGDGVVDWYTPITGDHYSEINEGSGGPNPGVIGAFQTQGDDNDIDEFSMENPSFEGRTSSQVVIWTFGFIIGANSPEIQVNIGGETHGPASVGLTTIGGWHSNTFTPDTDDWTELEATGLKVTYIANVPASKNYNDISTCYALFTYESPPGYGHDFIGVPAANIDNVIGVPAANIDKIIGV